MKSIFHKSLPVILPLASVVLAGGCSDQKREAIKPNIIYILADDLGYGGLGVYGQEKIETPNIDQLAVEGMRFTQHYSGSPVCAPARCVLLTGLHTGKSQVRGNDEWRERGDVNNYLAMLADSTLEGQRPMKEGTPTIGRALQSVGYTTAIFGKWGLGAPHTEGVPNKQGFDFFYGYNCQRQAHTYYPVHLWKNDRRVYLNNDTVAPHAPPLSGDLDPYDPASYARYNLTDYAPTKIFEQITQFVDENRDNPFFLYWASPIPHAPMQAPQKWVDYYVEKFGDEEHYVGRETGASYFPCRYPHATYAAMISYLDENVGKLIQQLKDLGLYDNTIIMFSSDNGSTLYGNHRLYDLQRYPLFFNSGGPLRSDPGYIKGSVYEGGIRVPMIVRWPGVVEPGTVSDHISCFDDVFPTLAEITGADVPVEVTGISFLPTLKGEKQTEREYLYWEFPQQDGQLAVRIGEMKAIARNAKTSLAPEWQLFNVVTDPQEREDISELHPEVISRVNEIAFSAHTKSPNENWWFRALGDF
jgi:arylsulfatase A-like enzyme